VNFVPLFPYLTLKNANLTSYTPPTARGLLFILKRLVRSKNTVIHLHGFCHPLIDLAAFSCIVMHKKYVITCHGIPKISSKTNKLAKLAFKLYLYSVERTVVQKASALTTVSSALKNECASNQLVNKKTLVIPNGANISLKPPEFKVTQELETKYAIKNKPVIFSIGRLSENKGFQYLIEAMQHVVSSVPNAVAFIAGSGTYKRQLEELIVSKRLTENVKLIGRISDEEKAAFYTRADAVVFPSTNEPFGIVLLEASMMHKPVIGFDIKSTREILSSDSALLVPVGNSLKLGRAIADVVTDPILKSELAAKSEKVKVNSWEKITDQYLNVYHAIN
jgi:glycosyltransferase involved in cell wall biosynthesis